MATTISPQELKSLAMHEGAPCVSLYLSTSPAGPQKQQNTIKLKNVLRHAELALQGSLPEDRIESLLRPVKAIVTSEDVWLVHDHGVGIFLAPEFFRLVELPYEVGENAYIGDRFHLLPLFPAISRDDRFYLLTLSRNGARLFEGARSGLTEVAVPNMPAGLADVRKFNEHSRDLQYHTAGAGGSAVFHSSASAEQEDKALLHEYFRLVDRAVHAELKETTEPLVLAGVDYLFPLYAEVNGYRHLLDGGVAGNPDGLPTEELHRRAWPLIEARLDRIRREQLDSYYRLFGTGLTSNRLDEISSAAEQGRVSFLFLPNDMRESRNGEAVAADGSDPLDRAAVNVMLNGGTVVPLPTDEVPKEGDVAAVFRY